MLKKTVLSLFAGLLVLSLAGVSLAAEAKKAPGDGKVVIVPEKAPKAVGPYSQGIAVGKIIYTSGQLPLNPATNTMPEGIKAQAKQSMDNVKAVVEAAGSSMEKVIKITIFVKDLNDFNTVNEVYGTYFTKDFPARSCVQVARLPKDALIEIEAIAVK